MLGKRGQAPVSVEQGITLSQQIGCVMYVETTARFNRQSVLSAFEVAALAALGQIAPKVSIRYKKLIASWGERYSYISRRGKTNIYRWFYD